MSRLILIKLSYLLISLDRIYEKTPMFPVILFSSLTSEIPSTSYIMDLKIVNQLENNVMQACTHMAKLAAMVILDQGGNILASQHH